MKILILYKINYCDIRNTILEHLYCFKNYAKNAQFHYFNATKGIPKYLTYIKYDGVIIHYTFLAERFHVSDESWKIFVRNIKNLKGYKVALPQDEYDETDKLCYLFKTHGISTVFTCFNREEDFLKAYPRDVTGLKQYVSVLTGYVDENEAINLKKNHIEYKNRPIDVGYRARKLPYYLGKHGQLKYELANIFLKHIKDSGLTFDISTTGERNKNVFLGKNWYKFLLSCKVFLGCEGGSSMLDPKGLIKKRVNEYIKNHPDANFEETEKRCFSGKDYNIKCFTVSPRHFEAIMTKTCQVLVEGEYGGILKPGVHYIELKSDFSNIKNVIELLKNEKYCQRIVDSAYNDIILSGYYSYKVLANTIIENIKQNNNTTANHYFIINNALFVLFGIFIIARNAFLKIIIALFEFIIYRPLKNTNLLNKIRNNEKYYKAISRLFPFL